MEILKKNILSVICGVIALIALIALFWPIGGMYADDQAKLDARKKTDMELTGLVKAPRFWPVIPDLQSGEKSSLKRFPSDKVIAEGLNIKAEVTKQANAIQHDTARNNVHQLLLDNILPNPNEQRFVFQQAYMQMVQDGKNPSTLRTELQGVIPPTDEDVHAAADKIWNAEFFPKILVVGGKEVNFQQVYDDWQKVCAGLQTKLRVDMSHKGKMYLDPGWISIQKQMPIAGNGPRETDIWFAQNMLWVQMDLIDAIKRLNQNANTVEEATVKHIFEMNVPDEMAMYVVNPTATGSNAPPTEAGTSFFAVSSTGRVSNTLYDVIQFDLVMNVDASQIPVILTELQRGRLITIQKANVSAVDGIAAAENGYVYGNVPVARLTLHGEELFLRDWTVPLMPPSIRQMLQVPPPAPHP
jgi:hypothetical protein